MGIFVGWVVRGRWFFIAAFLILLPALFIPGSNHTIRLAALSLAVALILVQTVLTFRDGFRAYAAHRPPPSPESLDS
jgi:hypothetical protein